MMKFWFAFLFFCIAQVGRAQNVELILPVGHQRALTKAIFSPDLKQIYTASKDNSISVWDLQTGREIRKLKGHFKPVNDIALSANGKYLVSGSDEGKALLWNTQNGKILKMMPHDFIEVTHVRIAPLTNFIVTAAYTSKLNKSVLTFWSLPGGDLGRKFDFPGEEILDVKICAEKKTTFIVTSKGNLYSVSQSFELSKLEYKVPMEHAVFDYNADYISSSSKNKVNIFSTASTPIVNTFSLNSTTRISALSFTNDSSTLLVATAQGAASLFNWSTGNELISFNAHQLPIQSIVISSNQQYVLTASADNSAVLFDAKTGRVLKRLEGKSIAVNDFSLLATDSRMLTLFADSSLKQWQITDRVSLDQILKLKSEQKLMSTTDEPKSTVISGCDEGEVIDLSNNQIIHAMNKSSNITKAVVSPDGNWVAFIDKYGIIKVSRGDDFKFVDFGKALKASAIKDFQIDKNNNLLVADENILKIYSLETGKIVKEFPVDPDTITAFAFSSNFKYYAISTSNIPFKHEVKLFNAEDGKQILKIDNPNILMRSTIINRVALSPDGNYLAYTGEDLLIHLIQKSEGKEIHSYYGHSDTITNLRFTKDGKFIISSSLDHTIRMWRVDFIAEEAKSISNVTAADYSYNSIFLTKYDPESWSSNVPTQLENAAFIALKNNDWIILTPDRYYFCNKGAAKELGYNKNGKYYSFEQFDLKYNRPDIVLKKIGVTDTVLIDAYKKAYEKRLRKMGFTEDQLNDDLNLPDIKIKNQEYIPNLTDSGTLNFQLEMKDDKYPLNRYYCRVNGVAVTGKNGVSIASENLKSIKLNYSVALTPGFNSIQFSVLNSKGAESYKTTTNIEYKPKQKIKSNLYIIAMSVSEYTNSEMNLRYAVKDGRDIVKTLASQKGFDHIIIDTFFNARVTRDRILQLKEQLNNTTVNDEVIVFVSGHGMLDANLDFYFATHDMDFNAPQLHGISYDALEDLLDSIPARKKLILMDACHSGELDKEEQVTIIDKTKKDTLEAHVSSFEARGSQLLDGESKVGLQNSFEMMQELFAGVNKGSGTVVISAAAGKGFAYESPKWNNGVFSYCIMNGIATHAADLNKDNEITARELLEYVSAEVEKLTHGAQKPTSRKENLEYDWVVWKYATQ